MSKISVTSIPASVCSETELATGISDHAGVSGAHHTKTPVDTTTLKVSDTLRNSNDGEKKTASDSYTKIKEVLLNADLLVCRLKFDMKRVGGAGYVYARVYKNGGAIGAMQETDGTGYVTKSQDFSGWVSGDLIQIYGQGDPPSEYSYVKNMRFYYDKIITKLGGVTLTTALDSSDDPTISMTNQDP